MGNVVLQMQHITKRYPGVVALNDVSVDFEAGQVHALLGENGAGKSTLIKVLSGAIENDEGQYDSPAEIFWATGACLFIRREVYLKAGGLDESFFAHMEEIDLCWRVKLLGYKIYTVPQSHMYHLGGATLSASEPRKTYLNFRNNLLMLYKNLPKNEGRRILIIRRLLDTIALARYIAGGEWQHARAVWLAHNHFRKERKRYHEQPDTNILKEMPEGRRNIVIDYFIRRKHTYRP